MVKPLHLRATNYRTFEQIDLELPSGCIAIVGPNGSGKSSLVLLPDLCLFGPESRSLEPYLTDDSIGADLELEETFEHDGKFYRVRRGFSSKGRGKATCDFERLDAYVDRIGPEGGPTVEEWEPLTRETIKETDALIASTIGMTRDTFRNSVYLAQGDGSFADPSWDPRQRKELLFTSLGLDQKWTPLLDMARRDKRATEAQLQELAGRVGTLEAEIAGKPEINSRALTARASEEAAEQAVADAELALRSVSSKIAEAEKSEGRRRELEARESAAQATWRRFVEIDNAAGVAENLLVGVASEIAALEANTSGREAAELQVETLEHEAGKVADKIREADTVVRESEERAARVLRRQAEITDLRAKADRLGALAAAVVSGEIKTCDRCKQTLPDDAVDHARESYLNEAKTLSDRILEIEREMSDDATNVVDGIAAKGELPGLRLREKQISENLSAARETVRQAQTAEVSLASLRAAADSHRATLAKTHAAGYADERTQAEIELTAARDAVAEINGAESIDLDALRREALIAESRVKEAQTRRDDARSEVARVEAMLERIAKAESDLAEAQSTLKVLNAESDLLAQLERAYGRDGIPALVIENAAIPAIEAEANRILAEFATTYRLELRTQRELKSGDGLADTLDVVLVGEQGTERPYETFSGGERSRINVALRIGLARLLAHRKGAETRILILDEIEYLDDAGQIALAGILQGLSSEFETILTVSHSAGLRKAFDQVIEVVKENGRSEVVA